jgi:hypothetical protein
MVSISSISPNNTEAWELYGEGAAIAELLIDDAWVLVEEGFTLAHEHEVESLFAISNGYVGNRGSLAEGSPVSSPAAFVAEAIVRRSACPVFLICTTAPERTTQWR